MAKWLLVVETNCIDPAKEAEFNHWYDKIHIPDIMETPGFTRIERHQNTEPANGKCKFFTSYEIETDDIGRFMKRHNDNMAKKRAAGRFSNLLEIGSRCLYRQINSVTP